MIKLSNVLAELDEKVLPNGKQKFFSIGFMKKNGEIVFIKKAVSTGLKADMKKLALRGIVEVDNNMNKIGHVYPVRIWSILSFNNQKVTL